MNETRGVKIERGRCKRGRWRRKNRENERTKNAEGRKDEDK